MTRRAEHSTKVLDIPFMSPFIMSEARILVRPSGAGEGAMEPVVLATVRFENYSNSAYKGAAPGCFRNFPVDVNVMPFKTGTPVTKARYVLEKLGINLEDELKRIRTYLENTQSRA